MRILIAAILAAGIAGAGIPEPPRVGFATTPLDYKYIYFAEIDESADWEINIYGADGQFYVWYYGYEDGGFQSYVFKVDSLTDIRPMPAEMEKGE